VILYLVALAVAATAGWQVNDWRWSAKWHQREAAIAATTTAAEAENLIKQQVLADAFARIDSDRTEDRRKADAETEALRARVAAGAVRLRLAAACPAPVLPAPAAGAGLDRGPGAELAAGARPDYFALRDGLTRVEDKLAACQELLAAERREAAPE